MTRREFPQCFEKSRRRGDAAHVAYDRLDDHRRNLRATLSERLLNRGDRIVRQCDGSLGKSLWNPRRVRDAKRRHAGTGLHQQRIDMPVIAAFELDGQVATRESASHAQRAHSGFGARVHEA